MSDNVQENMNQLLQSETDFGLSLLRQQNLNQSVVLSPVSVALALSLIHLASNGETKSQVRNVLAKDASDDQLIEHYSNLTSTLFSAEKGTEVRVANMIFANEQFPVKDSYIENAKNYYEAGASSLDFGDAEKAEKVINDFVSEKTKNQIQKIIKSDAISSDLVAILVSAFYFKGTWNYKFKSDRTENLEFFSNENDKRETPFLQEIGHRDFSENQDWNVLKLDYKDRSYSFFVFLPKVRFGLQKALENLDSETIQNLITNTSDAHLNIKIPKISIETSLGLKENLMKIGITDAFNQSAADLTNLADNTFVSSVSHKAKIDVDEDGTVAAASTTVTIMLKSLPSVIQEPIPFHADHPFLFLLTKDSHILFIGVYN